MSSKSSLIMYIIVRKDLVSWPRGALMAQACHACTAVLWNYREDETVVKYMNNIDSMRKVVLEVSDEHSLKVIDSVLNENNLDRKLWIEQPENEATCIAVKPYPKETVFPHLRKLKLFS